MNHDLLTGLRVLALDLVVCLLRQALGYIQPARIARGGWQLTNLANMYSHVACSGLALLHDGPRVACMVRT